MAELFLLACCVVVIVGAAFLLFGIIRDSVQGEAAERAEAARWADTPGFITTRIPREIREEIYLNKRYSWGGQPQPWHKCLAPFLVVAAIATVLITLKKGSKPKYR